MQPIYFDLDGTLTDPKPGITRSIQYALKKLGVDAPDEDALTWCIGPPIRDSFRTLLGQDAPIETAVSFYRERFADVGIFENRLYPDVEVMLSTLHGKGRRMFLATSKALVYAARIVAHFGLSGYFERLFGSEMDGTRSDKSELLAYALQITGAKNHPIMVGDRRHDMKGARNNKMTAFGVLYGYGSEKELRDAGADAVFATPADLLKALDPPWEQQSPER